MFKIAFVLIIVISCGFTLVGCKEGASVDRTSYDIKLSFDGENSLQGQERVNYQNRSDNALSFIQFNLFANAFKDKDSVVTIAEEERAYYNGYSEGRIEISSIKGENGDLEFTFNGENQEIMRVYLKEELYPDESIEMLIEFTLTLADVNHRLGRGENTINLGNFYPIVSVYENGKGFYENVYIPYGDPFYSQVADYTVEINCPDGYYVSASGYEINDGDSHIFKGENMRDFALAISTKFDFVEKDCDGCKIKYFGYVGDDNLNECLDISHKAVEYFSNSFGRYPYKSLSIVKNSFIQGGMEYPGLVMISDEVDEKDLCYVIVHEIAHQWWYAVVGNNQLKCAWIDEGLAEYSTLMFFREYENYGVDFKDTLDGCMSSYKIYEKVQNKVYGSVDGVMDKRLDEFVSSPDYVALTYTKSTLMFNCLEEQLGKKKFVSVLKSFYRSYSFKEVTRADLISSFSSFAHINLEGFFDSWLDGKIVIA